MKSLPEEESKKENHIIWKFREKKSIPFYSLIVPQTHPSQQAKDKAQLQNLNQSLLLALFCHLPNSKSLTSLSDFFLS